MADTTPVPGPLISIRPAKRAAGPDASAPPEVSVVVSMDRGEAVDGDRVVRLTRTLVASGEPFELLLAAGTIGGRAPDAASPPIDPRVHLLHHPGPPGMRAALLAAARTARAEFVAPVLRESFLTAEDLRSLREAMDPFGAYSYLPGSPAADVAMIVRGRSLPRGLLMYGLLGLYAGDLSGPFMMRRSFLEEISIESDGRSSLLEIVVKAKRAGRVVRKVVASGKAAASAAPSLADAWRLRSRLRDRTGS
jgi:hypothetical protein